MGCRNKMFDVSLVLTFVLMGVGCFPSFSQTTSQIGQVTETYNVNRLHQLKERFQKEDKSKQQQLTAIRQSKAMDNIIKERDGTVVDLYDIGVDGTLLYYETLGSPTSHVTRADALYDDGLMALGMTGKHMKVGVWDAGKARESHQEFQGRVNNSDKKSDVDSHSTMVMGTIVSAGVQKEAKGVAYAANGISNDWRSDKAEVVKEALNGLLLSNHSYGIKTSSVPDWYFGSYIQVSKDWDEIMYNAPYYLMVSAAGNAQNSRDNASPVYGQSSDGFDLLLGFSTSKNGLVVTGANSKVDSSGKLENVGLTSYSSYGPTDDGRIKPDLAGDGSSVYAASSLSDTSYGSSMGTSMAAPGITASLLLLQEYHQELYGSFLKAATLKGLALHTADDVFEPGPDYKLGWGVMNTMKAAQLLQRKDYTSLVKEEKLEESATYSINVQANGEEPLIISLSWTDPEGEHVNRGDLNSKLPALTNNLDVRVTKDGTTYYPWKLNPAQANSPAVKGDNLVDPYERINIANASGIYTITVTHKGNLKFGEQDFSLLVSGIKIGQCELTPPEDLTIAASNEHGCRLLWNLNEDTLYEFQYKQTGDDLWNTQALFDNTFELTGLELGQEYKARVRSVCTANLVSGFSEELTFVFKGAETSLESLVTNDFFEEEPLILYPNPTVHEIRVASNRAADDAFYYVTDMAGFVVKKGKLETAINVSDLAAGMYIVNVQDLEGSYRSKFIKR